MRHLEILAAVILAWMTSTEALQDPKPIACMAYTLEP